MRVLVCGGRHFCNQAWVNKTLNEIRGITEIINGGATGADHCAREWAKAHGVALRTFQAEWSRHGKRAGPLRNIRMILEGKPDLVVAFPGGRGTKHMVTLAYGRGVKVLRG